MYVPVRRDKHCLVQERIRCSYEVETCWKWSLLHCTLCNNTARDLIDFCLFVTRLPTPALVDLINHQNSTVWQRWINKEGERGALYQAPVKYTNEQQTASLVFRFAFFCCVELVAAGDFSFSLLFCRPFFFFFFSSFFFFLPLSSSFHFPFASSSSSSSSYLSMITVHNNTQRPCTVDVVVHRRTPLFTSSSSLPALPLSPPPLRYIFECHHQRAHIRCTQPARICTTLNRFE